MKIDILKLMEKLLSAWGIQATYLKPPYDKMESLFGNIYTKLFIDFNPSIIINHMKQYYLPSTIYMFEDNFKLSHISFRFPEKITQEYGYTFCHFGPILFKPITESIFQSVLETNNIPLHFHNELQLFYYSTPIISDMDSFINQTITLCSFLFQKEVKIQQMDYMPLNDFQLNFGDLTLTSEETALSSDIILERYRLENAFLNAVGRGDSTQAILLHNQFLQYKIVPRTSDQLRNSKNLFFVMNTLLRKKVEQSNVHPLHIDELSRKFAIKIENCRNSHQLTKLGYEMLRKYSLLVKNYSRTGYSAIVHQCLDYIDLHFMDNLSLSLLSTMCSVSETYLSTLFKKEVGITLTNYIQNIRIRKALLLLNSTNLPIQEIAVQCGFLDANYFSKIFKKSNGLSPREYREKIGR